MKNPKRENTTLEKFDFSDFFHISKICTYMAVFAPFVKGGLKSSLVWQAAELEPSNVLKISPISASEQLLGRHMAHVIPIDKSEELSAALELPKAIILDAFLIC